MGTYRDAGVDIDAGEQFAAMIRDRADHAWPGQGAKLSGFSGLRDIPEGATHYAMSTDGEGTKTLIAELTGNYGSAGQGAAAMAAVDIFVAGCRPHGLVDTLVVGKLDPERHIEIIDGIIEGCQLAGCVLLGGETAEHPGMYRRETMFDLSATAMGFPDPTICTGAPFEGCLVYAWPSLGRVANNGFSLVRRVFRLDGWPATARRNLDGFRRYLSGRSLGEALLEPTPIWIPEILQSIETGTKYAAHAHITGGGMPGNIPRVLPESLTVVVYRDRIQLADIFRLIMEHGHVALDEMERVFNMGVMMVSLVDPDGPQPQSPAFLIGEVRARTQNTPQVELTGAYD